MMIKGKKVSSDLNAPISSYYLFFWLMVFFFVILGLRLWYLQIIKGDELRLKSEINKTEVVELNPVRGRIMDRNGNILVDNHVRFDLFVKKSDISNENDFLLEMSEITGLPLDELRGVYADLPSGKNTSSLFLPNLSKTVLIEIENRRWRLKGLSINAVQTRENKASLLASHILGYLGEISQTQLDNERKKIDEGIRKLLLEGELRENALKIMEAELKPHRKGDLIGQSGIEQSLENVLQGRRGSSRHEIDSQGRLVSELETINPEPGKHVRLTIDSRLQGVAQSLLAERAGSIVVMDPNTFEILALASSPTYDLGDFIGGISRTKWKSLVEDRFYPMTNRAVAGHYPPGSTYKIVVALAALAEGVITPETEFHCKGSLQLGDSTFGCHNRYGHGSVNLKRSLKVSCDVYYYEVGLLLGVDKMAQIAREQFHLGKKPGVELSTEMAGLIPDKAWKMRRYNKRWALGETLPVSIGQGYVLNTPLQVAMFTATAANGGYVYRPYLVKEIIDVEGQVLKRTEPELLSRVAVKAKDLKAVQDGLAAVVGEDGGTGRRAAVEGIRISGKTGTSQVVSRKSAERYSDGQLPYNNWDHAWFTGYAPSEKPEVVITVLLEHAGGGGSQAAPVAKRMFEACFDKSIVADTLPPAQVQPDLAQGFTREGEEVEGEIETGQE